MAASACIILTCTCRSHLCVYVIMISLWLLPICVGTNRAQAWYRRRLDGLQSLYPMQKHLFVIQPGDKALHLLRVIGISVCLGRGRVHLLNSGAEQHGAVSCIPTRRDQHARKQEARQFMSIAMWNN